ncbi:OsmC family protein [Macrococcus armenti]|uniref:OsmC family protein n=1 Tax=Macrococcus armenti TaxID=2875764 RepID=UPI001CC9688E|nr:OsmC family protein [Macrococcus armenti]UBH12532.1 OsmC family protein [Macrococcus armenti]
MKHIFNCTATFNGGYNGVGTIQNRNLKTTISIPKEMNGPDIGTNPDEMLLSAAVTCFIITLSSMFERNHIPALIDYVHASATINNEKQVLTYESITYNVYLISTEQLDEKKIVRYVNKSEESCMITRALKGNVAVSIENIYLNNNILI